MYNSIETDKLYLCLYHARTFYYNQVEYISYSDRMTEERELERERISSPTDH
jgi:hypothetical protein